MQIDLEKALKEDAKANLDYRDQIISSKLQSVAKRMINETAHESNLTKIQAVKNANASRNSSAVQKIKEMLNQQKKSNVKVNGSNSTVSTPVISKPADVKTEPVVKKESPPQASNLT